MMLVITTWDNTLRTMRTCTMTRMDLFGAEWRCVLEGGMGQCVMTSGTMRMPLWSADNWDSPPMVSCVGPLMKNRVDEYMYNECTVCTYFVTDHMGIQRFNM